MLNTKNLVLEINDVPSYWVFKYYLNLSESLTGQDIKIFSIFNPNERTPSLCIYVDQKLQQYKFKCFSTGKNGSKIDLIKLMFNLDYSSAVRTIINDYNEYVKNEDFIEINFKPVAKWEIDFIKLRSWNEEDAEYWLSYRIGMSLLNEYNVKPIEYFNLVKEESGKVDIIKISASYIYGYYNMHDEIYKIYQPKSLHKFHKIKSHIQGIDQLKYDKPYLVICSSLKDAMCLKSIGYNVEVLAPESENTIIKPHIIEYLKKKYQKVITLFDNDNAGKDAVVKYKDTYGINGCTLEICKDISDAIQKYGLEKVHTELKLLLKTTTNK